SCEGPVSKLFSACFEARASLIEVRLDINDAELTILLLAVSGHSPEKIDAMVWNGDIGVVSAGHENGIAITNDGNELRILGVIIDKLNTICGPGHIEVYVHFFQHDRMFVRRPASPISRIGRSKSEKQPASSNIFADGDIDLAMLPGSAGFETERRVAMDSRIRDIFQRIALVDAGRKFGDVRR